MIEISAGNMTAALAPELGGAVMRVALAERDLLRPAKSAKEVAADPREAACFPCVPWFGRLFDGLTVDGRRYDLAPTLPACDPSYPLHGTGWVRPWRVETQQRDGLRCVLDYAPEPDGFPFPFLAAQDFTVAQDGFEIVLSLTNTGSGAIPAGLGLHPYFHRAEKTALCFPARHLWTPAPDGGGELLAPVPPEFDFSNAAAPGASGLDHSYGGWSGAVKIIGGEAPLSISSNASFLHVYAPARQDFLCLEPVTHLPGLFGGVMLNPAETMTVRLRLFVGSQAC